MSQMQDDLLRHALRARSEVPAVPPAPVDHLLVSGRALVRQRRRRMGAVAGVAVLVCTVAAGLALQPDDPLSHRPISPTPTQVPRRLADLPRGDLPKLPFAENGTLYVNGNTVDIEGGDPVLSVGGGNRVVLWTASRDGEPSPIRVLDPATGELGGRIGDTTSRPVVSADGRLIAWEHDNRDGSASVRLWDTYADSMLGQISFPFTPTCCDNPFGIIGIDAQGNVYGRGGGTTWIAAEQGTKPPRVLRGLGGSHGAYVSEVGERALVVVDGATTRVGDLDGDRIAARYDVSSVQATMSWNELYLAYVTAGADAGPSSADASTRQVRVRRTTSGAHRQMDLPADVEIDGPLTWETSTTLLVSVRTAGKSTAPGAWIRCFAETGRCELAATFRTELPTTPRR